MRLKLLLPTINTLMLVVNVASAQPTCPAFTDLSLELAQNNLASGSEKLGDFRCSPPSPQCNPVGYPELIADYPTDRDAFLFPAWCMFSDLEDVPGFRQLAIEGISEALTWLLKGQTLLGNDHVVVALGMRYSVGTPSLEAEIDELDLALDEFEEGTGYYQPLIEAPGNFDDSNLAELSRLTHRKQLARLEKADRLFALGSDSGTLRSAAGNELRISAQEAYLGAVVLAGIPETVGNSLPGSNQFRSDALRANTVFAKVMAGLDPAGFHGDYVPFLPYHDCNEQRSLKVQADRATGNDQNSNGALYWENQAKQTTRQVDINETTLRSNLASIRTSIVSELDQISGILTNTFFPNGDNLDDAAMIQAFGEAALHGTGTLGAAVAAAEEVQAELEAALVALQNIPEKIRIEQERVGQIAQVHFETGEQIAANDVISGWANAFSFSTSFSAGFPSGIDVSFGVNFSPGSIVSGYLNAENEMLRTMQQVQVEGINSAATIKLYLLEAAERGVGLRAIEARGKQQGIAIQGISARLLALLSEYSNALDDNASAYFNDPGYRLEMEDAIRRAQIYLRHGQAQSFLAARALGYDWARDYTGAELTSTCSQYSDFDSSESVFTLSSAVDVRDFFLSLDCWATYNFGAFGPLQAESQRTISIRQDILGFADFNPLAGQFYPPEIRAENKRLFKEFIRQHRGDDGVIEFEFSTSIADESLFDIFISNNANFWNVKFSAVAGNLVGPDLVVGPSAFGRVGLSIGGMSTVRTREARWRPNNALNDLLVQYDLDHFGEDESLRTVSIDASLNGFPPAPAFATGLTRLSVGATSWKIAINTEGTENQNLDFDNLEDIQLLIRYRYGQPPLYSQCD